MRIEFVAFLIGACVAAGSADAAKFQLPPTVTATPAPAGSASQTVKLARALVTITDGEHWGTWGDAMACDLGAQALIWNTENAEIYTKRLDAAFDQELSAAGFSGGSSDNLFDTGAQATLQVGASIRGIQARLCGAARRVSLSRIGLGFRGGMVLDIEWQIYDPLEKRIVGRVSTHAGGEEKEIRIGGEEYILVAAFRQNVRALLNDTAFRTLVLARAPATAAIDAPPPIVLKAAAQGPRSLSVDIRSVATVIAPGGSGSGFLVSSDGYLLTNEHVVRGSQRVKIKWSDGTETAGEVVRANARRDVALIKADPGGREAIPLRKGQPAVGDAVFAIGTPVQEALQNTVTKGIVSALRTYEGQAFIQSDVAVTHGNSGGPLIDDKGAVVGMTDLGIAPEGVQIGLNLFIPIDEALKALALKPAG